MTYPVATAETESRVAQAIVAKATRDYKLPHAPFGFAGEVTEYGVATVRPDYTTTALLFGLRAVDLTEIDLSELVTTDDVIRGLQMDPATFPPGLVPDVERALAAAVDGVRFYLEGAWGVA